MGGMGNWLQQGAQAFGSMLPGQASGGQMPNWLQQMQQGIGQGIPQGIPQGFPQDMQQMRQPRLGGVPPMLDNNLSSRPSPGQPQIPQMPPPVQYERNPQTLGRVLPAGQIPPGVYGPPPIGQMPPATSMTPATKWNQDPRLLGPQQMPPTGQRSGIAPNRYNLMEK
jgi:hypothetical protein